MDARRPKAQALIARRYVERGATTRIVVAPLAGSGLPESLVQRGRPVPLDLLAGRPVGLEMDAEGLRADLCFGGPPVRCAIPWSAVLAVQSADGEDLLQTVVVTLALRMEDDSLMPVGEDEPGTLVTTSPAGDGRRPRLHVVK